MLISHMFRFVLSFRLFLDKKNDRWESDLRLARPAMPGGVLDQSVWLCMGRSLQMICVENVLSEFTGQKEDNQGIRDLQV